MESIASQDTALTCPPKPKLYVLVRADLSLGQQMAQAAHAGIELQRNHNTPETIVILNVRDMAKLQKYFDLAPSPAHMFWEPDYSEFTAFACVSTGEIFAGLKLAGKESKAKRLWRKISGR